MGKIVSFEKIFNNLRSFFEPDFLFHKAISDEQPEKLKELNKAIEIEVGQTWRSAMDFGDKYSEPVFLKISDVDFENDIVFFTNSYTGEKIHEKSISNLKSHFVLVK